MCRPRSFHISIGLYRYVKKLTISGMKKHIIIFIWVAVGVMAYNTISTVIALCFFSKDGYEDLSQHGILGFLIQIVVVYFLFIIMRYLWQELRK